MDKARSRKPRPIETTDKAETTETQTKGAVMNEATKKAQEMFTQGSGKAVETMTLWADANQRVLRELAELSAATAQEGVRLYAELQQSGLDALREAQAADHGRADRQGYPGVVLGGGHEDEGRLRRLSGGGYFDSALRF